MSAFDGLAPGFGAALQLEPLAYCFLGVFLGMLIGVLPGIGALTTVSMLLPITFYLDPLPAIVMLAGIFYGAEYGGSTASILLNLPGTTSSAVTCLDGNPMAKQGRAGVALFTTTLASFIGGTTGIMLLVVLTPMLASVALSFGAAEYFALMLLGLVASGTITQGSPLKGLVMVALGLFLGTVGTDVNTGTTRLTLGVVELYDGINLIAMAMGLFGVAEVIASINGDHRVAHTGRITLSSMLPTRSEARRSAFPMLRGLSIGSLLGALPGTGPTIASFIAYAVEKRVSRTPQRFGNGAIEGIASPEAANNAAAQTAFVPTLSLGIPGSATMALILGALMIHGIPPGPNLITDQPTLFWGVVASFWIGNLILLVLNIPLIGIWVGLLRVPYELLYPAILCLICIGVYSINNSPFDIFVVLAFGVLGYGLRLLGFEPAPLLIGFVLGPLMEENFRRALLLSRGDFLTFLERPISGAMMVAALALLAWALLPLIAGRDGARRSVGTTREPG